MLFGGAHLTPAAITWPSAQLRPVRMLESGPMILVDLPVDVAVVLEQQE